MKAHYPMIIEWSEEDKCFIAVFPDLPGCSAWGDRPDKAAAEAEVAMELWLDVAGETGRPIPVPRHLVASVPRNHGAACRRP